MLAREEMPDLSVPDEALAILAKKFQDAGALFAEREVEPDRVSGAPHINLPAIRRRRGN